MPVREGQCHRLDDSSQLARKARLGVNTNSEGFVFTLSSELIQVHCHREGVTLSRNFYQEERFSPTQSLSTPTGARKFRPLEKLSSSDTRKGFSDADEENSSALSKRRWFGDPSGSVRSLKVGSICRKYIGSDLRCIGVRDAVCDHRQNLPPWAQSGKNSCLYHLRKSVTCAIRAPRRHAR